MKKNTIRRWLCMAMAAIVSVSVLAGCATGEQPSSGSTSGNAGIGGTTGEVISSKMR